MDEALDTTWHLFGVEGGAFYWTAYPSKQRTGHGPWEPCEYVSVARAPNVAGVGAAYPAGTVVGEEQAVELVRLFRRHGKPIP